MQLLRGNGNIKKDIARQMSNNVLIQTDEVIDSSSAIIDKLNSEIISLQEKISFQEM